MAERNVYIGGIPFSWTAPDLDNIARVYGRIEKSRVFVDQPSGKSRGFGLVLFSAPEEADQCVRELHGVTVDGGSQPLQVRLARGGPKDGAPRGDREEWGRGGYGSGRGADPYDRRGGWGSMEGRVDDYRGGYERDYDYGYPPHGEYGMSHPGPVRGGYGGGGSSRSFEPAPYEGRGGWDGGRSPQRYAPYPARTGGFRGEERSRDGGLEVPRISRSIDEAANIHIYGLSQRVDENFLYRMFAQIGGIKSVFVERNRETRETKGYGFVQFWRSEDAQDAISSFDGQQLDGREMKVTIHRPKVRR